MHIKYADNCNWTTINLKKRINAYKINPFFKEKENWAQKSGHRCQGKADEIEENYIVIWVNS